MPIGVCTVGGKPSAVRVVVGGFADNGARTPLLAVAIIEVSTMPIVLIHAAGPSAVVATASPRAESRRRRRGWRIAQRGVVGWALPPPLGAVTA